MEELLDKKGIIQWEKTINDRKYTLLFPMNAPSLELYDFCYLALVEITEMIKKATEEAKRKEPEVKAAKEEGND